MQDGEAALQFAQGVVPHVLVHSPSGQSLDSTGGTPGTPRLKQIVTKLLNALRLVALGRQRRRLVTSSTARQAGLRLSRPLAEGEREVVSSTLSLSPLMLRTHPLLQRFAEYGDGRLDALAASTIHAVKVWTARSVWKDHVEPLRSELDQTLRNYNALRDQFKEVRSTYLREVAALRDDVRVRGDPETSLGKDQLKDITHFLEPMRMLQSDELTFALEVVKEKLKMIFESNPSVTIATGFGQIERLKELLVNSEISRLKDLANKRSAELLDSERERRQLQRELAVATNRVANVTARFSLAGESSERTLLVENERLQQELEAASEANTQRASALKIALDRARTMECERDDAMREMQIFAQTAIKKEAELEACAKELRAVRKELSLHEFREGVLKDKLSSHQAHNETLADENRSLRDSLQRFQGRRSEKVDTRDAEVQANVIATPPMHTFPQDLDREKDVVGTHLPSIVPHRFDVQPNEQLEVIQQLESTCLDSCRRFNEPLFSQTVETSSSSSDVDEEDHSSAETAELETLRGAIAQGLNYCAALEDDLSCQSTTASIMCRGGRERGGSHDSCVSMKSPPDDDVSAGVSSINEHVQSLRSVACKLQELANSCNAARAEDCFGVDAADAQRQDAHPKALVLQTELEELSEISTRLACALTASIGEHNQVNEVAALLGSDVHEAEEALKNSPALDHDVNLQHCLAKMQRVRRTIAPHECKGVFGRLYADSINRRDRRSASKERSANVEAHPPIYVLRPASPRGSAAASTEAPSAQWSLSSRAGSAGRPEQEERQTPGRCSPCPSPPKVARSRQPSRPGSQAGSRRHSVDGPTLQPLLPQQKHGVPCWESSPSAVGSSQRLHVPTSADASVSMIIRPALPSAAGATGGAAAAAAEDAATQRPRLPRSPIPSRRLQPASVELDEAIAEGTTLLQPRHHPVKVPRPPSRGASKPMTCSNSA
eukprot:TRINITY_DN1597_c0_g3_i2.p1 TRINITY_DN1597_c0_g3~~TRINITY_DN1597_c0_g3_i2.p1  ORF type:complete len:955 (+),score=181.69 TRINITY_DN1597_c0_g3_i2:53-2917(+)